MATTTELVNGPGALWLRAIDLWYGVVQGTYTAWTYSWTPDGDFRVFTITVTNPDTSTDDFILVDVLSGNSNQNTLTYLVNSPGFRNPLPVATPAVMPDTSDTWRSFRDGPIALRQSMFSNYCNASQDSYGHDNTGTRYGVTVYFYPFTWYRGLSVVSDCMTLLTGTLSADSSSGPPTDGVGGGTITAPPGGGGGGTPDLTPVVDAILSISDQEVDYQCNQTGDIWSIKSRVRTS